MKKGFVYIALATFFFSTMEIALKFVAGVFNPVQLTFSRILVGGLVLLPFAVKELKKRGVKLQPKSFLTFAGLGFVGFFISNVLYQMAVATTKASVVAVLFSSNPIFVLFFAYLILHEPIHKHQVVALCLDVLGVLVLINPFATRWEPFGIICILFSTVTFSLYGVLGKRACGKYGGLVVTCFSFLCGSAEIMAAAALTHIPAVSAFFSGNGFPFFADIPFINGYTWDNLPIMAYIYIGVTGVGFACYFKAMEATSAATTSLVFFFKPALAPILAFFILKEDIPLPMLLGILCILAGALIAMVPGLRPKKKEGVLEAPRGSLKPAAAKIQDMGNE